MARCQSKPNLKKAFIIHSVFFTVALAINALIVYIFDAAMTGWFFFIIISSLGVLFAYREKGDRFTTINVIMMIVISLIFVGIIYISTL